MKQLFGLLGHFVCFVIVVLLFGWVILHVRTLDARFGVRLPMWTQAPGVVCMAAAIILMLVCGGVFLVWGEGTPFPLGPTKRLVALGPFRYVRTPIPIGQLAFFIGLGLYLRSVSVLLFALVWFLFCYFYVVLFEERSLRKKFGASYEEYCKAVPRWVPTGLAS